MANRRSIYKFYYIYKTTNLINNKIYIGQKSANVEPGEDFKYLGSGRVLKQAIIKNGRANFKKEILEICTQENLNEREIFWIKELDSMNPEIGYNLTKGGETTSGWHPTKESLERMSNAQKGEKSFNYGKRGKDCHNYGRRHSEESLRKNREANSGENNAMWGKHHPEEVLIQIAESWKTRNDYKCEFCGFTTKSKMNITKYHDSKCKQNPDRQITLYSCEWCDTESENKTNIIRFHNENCKQNPNRKS